MVSSALLLAEDVVLVLEFKVGSDDYDAASRRQVEDYALDLRDFHKQSRDRIIVPILVATEASAVESKDTEPEAEFVRSIVLANKDNLADVLLDAFRTHHDPKKSSLELELWDNSAYRPVPTVGSNHLDLGNREVPSYGIENALSLLLCSLL